MAAMHLTLGDGSTKSSAAAQWSDLPDDLLGMVRFTLSSLRDRVRFAAVCKPWRDAAARLPPPPAVPQLLLSPTRCSSTKHLCSPDGSWVLPVPGKLVDKWFVGSHGSGWIAAADKSELTIKNLFSGAEVVICSTTGYLQNPVSRIIFSDVPTSNSCMVAAIGTDWLTIALCKVGGDSTWITKDWHKQIFGGIAFCNGDLYGLLHLSKKVVKFGISMDEDGSPAVTSTHQLDIQGFPGSEWYDDTYILELRGQLSMAVRSRWLPNRERFFKVFRLVHAAVGEAYEYKWEEVADLGDHALFLGPMSSMAVHVPVGAARHGLQRNHIYYSCTTNAEMRFLGNEVYWVISSSHNGMYYREDPSVGDGVKRAGYHVLGWNNSAVWIYPPDL